jgi:hypothetical protein
MVRTGSIELGKQESPYSMAYLEVTMMEEIEDD